MGNDIHYTNTSSTHFVTQLSVMHPGQASTVFWMYNNTKSIIATYKLKGDSRGERGANLFLLKDKKQMANIASTSTVFTNMVTILIMKCKFLNNPRMIVFCALV